jgi:hypothetical protein
MSKASFFCILSLALLVVGCNGEDDNAPQPNAWEARHLWPHGARPVSPSVGEDVLFMQEEAPSGLYLLRDSVATHLNSNGPAVQPDYSWSNDGSRYCFSSPGLSGEGLTGIYYAAPMANAIFHKLWDRGSHPRFLPGDTMIVCAGPEDGSDADGIWQIHVADLTRTRLAERGVAPEVSPDGRKIAYLVTEGAWFGRTLVVYDRFTHIRDTLGLLATSYTWLGDSRTLIYETAHNGFPELYKTAIGGVRPGETMGISGVYPCGFKADTEFVYTAVVGDVTAGVYLRSGTGDSLRLLETGTMAITASEERVLVQSSEGIFEVER